MNNMIEPKPPIENDEIKQYLFEFVVQALNECKAFSKIYGKEFIEEQLRKNINVVLTNAYTTRKTRGSYNSEAKAIILTTSDPNSLPLTKEDVENDRTLKHYILHEALHAIFEIDSEYLKDTKIKNATGLDEIYSDGGELGIGLNEGLTEWICQKAGYGCISYMAECNIVRLLELAIGEENVMKLAQGNITGNAEQILDLSPYEYTYTMRLIDEIHNCEIDAASTEDKTVQESKKQILDKKIAHFEATIFEKYFGNEIDAAINSKTLSIESERRLSNLSMLIQGGETSASDIFSSQLPLKFKREIYPQLFERNRQVILQEIHDKNQQRSENFPSIYKINLLDRLRNFFAHMYAKMKSFKTEEVNINNQSTKKSSFSSTLKNMSNYSTTENDSRMQRIQSTIQRTDKNSVDLPDGR